MAFIDTIGAADAAGDTREMYARQQAHYGYVPSYAKVFCHRPEVMRRWAELQSSIKRHMSKRQFELVTFAAAHTLRSTLCSLAHGKALLEFFSPDDVAAIARGEAPDSLTPAEAALVDFGRTVARDACAVTRADVIELKRHGFSDAEIFDAAATAAARAFWTKVVESLGADSDAPLHALDETLKDALAVGRPARFVEPERLPEAALDAVG
jgi:uncharacterized peroxidase-related enzyme